MTASDDGAGPRWWVGIDEHGGIPNPGRPDASPPPTWRLEAVAATHRVRHATVSPDGATVAVVVDDDSSDVWTVPVDGGEAVRVTVGRPLAAYWEDAGAAWSPDGRRLAFTQHDAVFVVPVSGGPAVRVCTGSAPAWLDDRRLIVGVDRDGCTALATVSLADPWPERLAMHHGDCFSALVSPDGDHVAHLVFHHDDLNCTSLHVVDLRTGRDRVVVHEPATNVRAHAWAPDGCTLAYASETTGWYEIHVAELGATEGDGPADVWTRRLTNDSADFADLRFTADGSVLVATRTRRGVADLVSVDVSTGAVTVLAAGGTWSTPVPAPDGSVVAVHESFARPARLCRVHRDGRIDTVLDRAPAPVRTATHVIPEHVSYRSTDGLEVHGWLYRPAGASAAARCPVVVQPHGGPTSVTGDEWDGVAQYFVDRGYGWFAVNPRGSTTYGRAYERANHGVWGVADTQDCLAAHDHLATLEWVDTERVAIFGASYGSYMALHAVVDDPQHRYAAAVMKYGDCDILTSWAQGDQVGRLDLERMMGHPHDHPQAYRAGSPIHRIEQLVVPVLVAHGELDRRVSPAQAHELVDALRRLGHRYEFVTYPTEGHGLLRTEPFLDFHRRLERFLDWHLMPRPSGPPVTDDARGVS